MQLFEDPPVYHLSQISQNVVISHAAVIPLVPKIDLRLFTSATQTVRPVFNQ